MNRAVVAVEGLVFLVGVTLLAGIWAFSTPAGMNLVLRRLVGDAPFAVTIENAALAPTVGLAPETWRVTLTGIDVVPTDPERPTVHVTRLTVGSPELVRAWARRELRFALVQLVGLDIHAKHQHQPRPWTPHKTALDRVTVDDFDLWDTSVIIDADGPLAAVDLRRVDGHVTGLVYEPATRAIFGEGSFSATSFKDGAAQLHRLELPKVTATGDRLEWRDGTVVFGGGGARLDGMIEGLKGHPTVTLKVHLVRVDLSAVVAAATGKESPLGGELSADLDVHAGGDLPRGQAWAEGTLQLDGGNFAIQPDTKAIVLKLVEASHLATVSNGRLALHPLSGRLRLQRGRVELQDLRYALQRRELQLRGTIDDKVYTLVLRLMPESDPERRPGLGLVLSGTAGEGSPQVRRATDGELLGHDADAQ